ncbi:MAG: DUF6569 family protein [Acidobacteriota bacterium]
MNRLSWVVGIVVLFVIGAAAGCGRGSTAGNSKAGASLRLDDGREVRLSGPFIHKNLTVYLVCGKDAYDARNVVTLEEAIQRKTVVVHETGSVGELSVENLSEDEHVFIQAGDVVKGGRQDRTVQYDMIVGPKSGEVPLKSFCVEQGRWSARGGEDAAAFSQSKHAVNAKELKAAIRAEGQQGKVWEKVAEVQRKMSESVGARVNSDLSPSSLQLAMENSGVRATTDEYLQTLRGALDAEDDAIGFVACVNGKVASADIYGSAAILEKVWEKMLTASAQEAIAESAAAGAASSPVPAAAEIVAFILKAEAEGRAAAEKRQVSSRTEEEKREAAEAYVFESFDKKDGEKGQSLRKSYVAK